LSSQKLGRACFEIECDEIGLIAALRNTPFWQSANFFFCRGIIMAPHYSLNGRATPLSVTRAIPGFAEVL
jgi:hypothetical protein